MFRIIGILAAAAAVMLMGCGAPAKGEVCDFARFEFTPQQPPGTPPVTIENRQVCFKSMNPIGGCNIWNYRIPPKIDFTDYIDIHYDPSPDCQTNSMDGEFDVPGKRYVLNGTPAGTQPPEAPRGTTTLMASGDYTAANFAESGTFKLYW
jgi:hypothetical protein